MHLGLLLGGAAGGVETHTDSAVSRWMRKGLLHATAEAQWRDNETSPAQQALLTAQTRAFGDSLRRIVSSLW